MVFCGVVELMLVELALVLVEPEAIDLCVVLLMAMGRVELEDALPACEALEPWVGDRCVVDHWVLDC